MNATLDVHIVYLISAEEISRLVEALSELGDCKIRLTGGKPTVRKVFYIF